MIYIIILLVIIIILLYFIINQRKKENTTLLNKYKELEDNLVDSACIKLNERVVAKQQEYTALNTKVNELSGQYEKFSNITKEQIQKEIDAWKEVAIAKTTKDIDECVKDIREEYFGSLMNILDMYEDEKTDKKQELEEIKKVLDDYKQKQKTINEEILRRRAVEEQTDFYRVVIDENSLDDIALLQSIRKNLHHRENLDKLIYDNYVSKPVSEMIKRVLNGKSPSGIYKITRLQTGEIYIGKSTNVKDRWQQHAKTAFNCGTIAHSMLHTTMEKDGIENFTFELLEEVPKDKLSEKEKYYIDFYGSKEYGMNEKAGG